MMQLSELSSLIEESLNSKEYSGYNWRLARRIARREMRKRGKRTLLLCAVVETSRHYGGPEEGGWFYNTSETVEVKQAYRWQRARQILKDWKNSDEYAPPEYDIYSCANRGEGSFSFHLVASDECLEALDNSKEATPHYC